MHRGHLFKRANTISIGEGEYPSNWRRRAEIDLGGQSHRRRAQSADDINNDSWRGRPLFVFELACKFMLNVLTLLPMCCQDLMASRLSLLDHDADSDMTAKLDGKYLFMILSMLIHLRWLADDEDVGPSSVTNPIVFSEDPLTCSNEMLEFANDLVDVAVTKMAESVEIMDASHIKDLSRWKQRWGRF